MTDGISKIKLKGNESFNFREGWLRKGMRCVEQDPMLFSQDDVMERLGVGSKMVKSIRFWLQATGLCKEVYTNGGRSRAQAITEDFGQVIQRWDRYFEDYFTLCLLHYKIVSNESQCPAWNLFFNDFQGMEFTREDVGRICLDVLQRRLAPGVKFSEKSLADDCSSVIRMYLRSAETENLEEDLSCPLSELGLLQRNRASNVIFRTAPSREKLDMLAVLYVIVSNLPEDKYSVCISVLCQGENNVGRVFQLSRYQINEYLDQLRVAGYINLTRTAGLDTVYLRKAMTPAEIMETYYERAQVGGI